jgi:hypothetical protein
MLYVPCMVPQHVRDCVSSNIQVYPTRYNVTQFIFIWKLFYMFRVVPPPIIRSAYNSIYGIWYLSHRYRYLPLSWKSWNWFECVVYGVRHPQHTQTSSNTSTIAAGSSNGVINTRYCRYSCLRPWWRVMYHPKHVEQFPDKINCVTLHLVGHTCILELQ